MAGTMSLALQDGMSLTIEIALTSSTSDFAIWDVSRFDTGRWGPDEVWVDVSDWVRSSETHRSFSEALRLWTAGTITVVLNNRDGRFSPDNLTGPYASGGISGIIPGRPIRVSLGYGGVDYPIFHGWIDSWDEGWETYEGQREGDAWVTVEGTDDWARFAAVSGITVSPVGALETLGPRLSRILDVLGFAGPRSLDTGMIPLQATDLSADPIQEIETTLNSEGGSAWIAADGTFIGRDRYSLVEDPRSITVQATFGDNGTTETPWESITTAPLTTDHVINIARYTAVGGTAQYADDLSSRAIYGDKQDKASWVDSLICTNDSDVLVLAQWTVAVNKLAQGRVTGIAFKPRCNPAILVPLLFSREVRDLVEINRRPPSATSHVMTRRCHISGIHTAVSNGDVDISFDFEPAGTYQIYATSRFDVGTFGDSDIDPTGARFFI
jgi:hypothetical protein